MPILIIVVVVLVLALTGQLTPRKKYNCDECQNLIGENPPFVDRVMGERVDFCSERCRQTFLNSIDENGESAFEGELIKRNETN